MPYWSINFDEKTFWRKFCGSFQTLTSNFSVTENIFKTQLHERSQDFLFLRFRYFHANSLKLKALF